MKFLPLNGYCLCEAPSNETTDGGIIVPESNIDETDKTPIKLKVVAVGPGEQLDGEHRRDVIVEPGRTYFFIFPAYSLGAAITLSGVKYVVIQSKFVCGEAV